VDDPKAVFEILIVFASAVLLIITNDAMISMKFNAAFQEIVAANCT